MSRFSGKSLVITGGSSGIGLAAAKRIVAEGGRVLITGTNAEKLAEADNIHADIHVFLNDASDLDGAGNLAVEAKRLFTTIDGAFLNAGVGAGAPLGHIKASVFQELMNLNVGGPLFGAQALSPLMNEGGSFLITASAAKDKGMVGSAIYSASKGAVRSMTRALARELAPRNIRANTVSPGPIETPFFERLGRPQEQMDMLYAHIKASNPLGRLGSVDEAANVAVFLLSSEATFVTGSDYAVDGGEAQL